MTPEPSRTRAALVPADAAADVRRLLPDLPQVVVDLEGVDGDRSFAANLRRLERGEALLHEVED